MSDVILVLFLILLLYSCEAKQRPECDKSATACIAYDVGKLSTYLEKGRQSK